MNSKKRKIFSSVVATTLAAAILLTGTFAWQSISQTAKNEVQAFSNPGGRLHDDFDGKNKDVYVENFTDPNQEGVPIFARVKLDEYMEIGEGAGTASATNVQKVGNPNADRNNPSTWTTHLHDYNEPDHDYDGQIHEYWNLSMGGKTVYMPTFNKNKDSKKADINGTFEGPDKNPATKEDRYQDYKKYTVGQTETAEATYDNDDNNVEDGGVTTKEETHTAKETQTAQVITMDEWKQKGEPIGDYWVYDKDGWAYWAEPILPGETTGLLLDGINLYKEPEQAYYYAINVTAQFATAGDWGNKDQNTGFYADKFSEDGRYLLSKVSGTLPKVRKVRIKDGATKYVRAGDSLTLEAEVDVKYPIGIANETAVKWTSDTAQSSLKGNIFTARNEMAGKKYTVTATSLFDETKTADAIITVYPKDAVGVVDGNPDGKKYVDFGDNTFKEIKADGTLGNFICGGKDTTIGNVDDITEVIVVGTPSDRFGSKFLETEDNGIYWAVGADGKLGTADDVKVTGNPWPQNITDRLADQIIITTVGDKDSVKPFEKLQFNAEVKLNGRPISVQDVTWAVTGNKSGKTEITQEGLLKVGADEKYLDNATITVTATSKLVPGLTESKVINVNGLGIEDIPMMEAGTTTPIVIDNMEWYVLVKEGEEALLWAKEPIKGSQRKFSETDANANWKECETRTYLNKDWLNTTNVVKTKALQKNITTRKFGQSQWDTTQDKVFLLSEADLFGTYQGGQPTSDGRDYTYGNKAFVSNAVARFTVYDYNAYTYLRSPYSSAGNTSAITTGGSLSWGNTSWPYVIRPAIWINFRR